ncbi:MAG: accessory Sec system translocase SecA2 [Saprospiraceae bacterium]|nr:accessory Sec system translocase SecA2 [Saprospiraceae bacterium]MCB9324630.1 accessory Sec system translocase SecA2 [Lewinellaceae bacterium]
MKFFQKIKEAVDPSLGFFQNDLSNYQKLAAQINDIYQKIEPLSDRELQQSGKDLMTRARGGEHLDFLLPEVFALVKETCIRQLGLVPFEVQLMAAIALHEGKLVEMQTGEGKTLAAVFPALLHALTGRGVHVLTFNDYLARRDATEMGAVYSFLGLSVGYISEQMSPQDRKKAYACDVTYATAKEVGFDYLRDFIAYEKQAIVLRSLHYCIVDEADAILIDEARTPLVLAGSLVESGLDHYAIAGLVSQLNPEIDFELDDNAQNVFLTDAGIKKVETGLGLPDLHAAVNFEWQSAVNLALHARILLRKDVDYIVKNEEIHLVDEFTGRIVKDRKWRNGLQTAVEAKEGVEIRSEGSILNSISLQHLLRKYDRPAGMTATARQSAAEFAEFYGLTTVIIPPNKKCLRVDFPDRVFTSRLAKRRALITEIINIHQKGQPVLIGTLSVKESEELEKALQESGMEGKVLNAKNDEKEAAIIAEAGRRGAITISTNMAGRGTDIKLGGCDGIQKKEVEQLGGLYVIGTNKHESARIDLQLRGRAGRQGDPGVSRFFVSFEDELMVRFNLQEMLPKKYQKLQIEKAISDPGIGIFLNDTQKVIEGRFFDMRKMLFEYASFLEKQRIIFQEERQMLLLEEDFMIEKYRPFLERYPKNTALLQKAKAFILFAYDKNWADHLDYMMQVRDGIHLQRFGGFNPLRVFRQNADEHFQNMQLLLENEIKENLARLLKNPELSLEAMGMKRPSATWTYIISDNTFGDQLSIMLLDNSNIGFQVDFISAFFLAIFSLVKKWRRKRS